MASIRTRFLPPTDNLGPRIRAWSSTGAKQMHRAAASPACVADHDAAARALAYRLRWSGELVRGDLSPDEGGYVYVFAHRERVAIPEP